MEEGLSHPVVMVTWMDAHAATETWTPLSELDQEPCIVTSCGFLLAVEQGGKPDHVTIYQSKTESDDVDGVLCIPVAMVKTLKVFPINT
jgi:hypothetical protein